MSLINYIILRIFKFTFSFIFGIYKSYRLYNSKKHQKATTTILQNKK